MKALIASIFLLSITAQAAPVTADQMTCSQLIHVANTTGKYYKIANGNDIIPIYGFNPVDERGYPTKVYACSSKKIASPIFEQTMDKADCFVGFICVQN